MKVLVVVEDDPDVQFLVETIFAMDSRFALAGVADSAEVALETARTSDPGVIVLDHGLAGSLTGLDAAPLQRASSTLERSSCSTAFAELQTRATAEPA